MAGEVEDLALAPELAKERERGAEILLVKRCEGVIENEWRRIVGIEGIEEGEPQTDVGNGLPPRALKEYAVLLAARDEGEIEVEVEALTKDKTGEVGVSIDL